MNKTLITLSGPTASGKTALAIRLAQALDADIFSCDSRQFYKEMSIGTAVPTKEELSLVPHHFIQHQSIHDPYSIGNYERDALHALNAYFTNKDTALLVGGSGLYMQAITVGLDVFPNVSESIRAALGERLHTAGLVSLQQELELLDPDYYQQVDVNNPSRVMRALGVCLASGQPYSSFLGKPKPKRPYAVLPLTIEIDRNQLYNKINQRVDLMMDAGLMQEAHSLYPHRNLNALQTVGYKELFDFFDGKVALNEAVAAIKQHTRNFAKRQLTWVRRKEKAAHKIDANTPMEAIVQLLE